MQRSFSVRAAATTRWTRFKNFRATTTMIEYVRVVLLLVFEAVVFSSGQGTSRFYYFIT